MASDVVRDRRDSAKGPQCCVYVVGAATPWFLNTSKRNEDTRTACGAVYAALDGAQDILDRWLVQRRTGPIQCISWVDTASGQPVAVDQIEPGDRIWCPVDVDLADSPQPAEVDFWDYLSAPPASPPRTASGRLKPIKPNINRAVLSEVLRTCRKHSHDFNVQGLLRKVAFPLKLNPQSSAALDYMVDLDSMEYYG
ncbi:hypothetical protein DFH08DRAFT_824783 [Mycena albidolilacea]|uniref:Uncharacterized protein n=1 Tax=Mycena albidolilacea TaxID=1033008 RepID=A0AAD7EAT9_9AGAR|nr:hypothetical protein DFH08DRAFT_824783 [Mycena albidolilacea]